MNLDLRAMFRGGATNGAPALAEVNERKELLTAQGLPRYTEMSRLGQGYSVRTATLFDPVAAYPTTTAELEVYNNTPNKVLVVHSLFAAQVLSTAATQTYAIMAMVTTRKAAPTNTALSIHSLSGKQLITSTAAGDIITGVGTTVVDNGWSPWGNPQAWGTAAATPGNAWDALVDGALIVPPYCALALAIFGSIATASSFQCGARFYMSQITPE